MLQLSLQSRDRWISSLIRPQKGLTPSTHCQWTDGGRSCVVELIYWSSIGQGRLWKHCSRRWILQTCAWRPSNVKKNSNKSHAQCSHEPRVWSTSAASLKNKFLNVWNTIHDAKHRWGDRDVLLKAKLIVYLAGPSFQSFMDDLPLINCTSYIPWDVFCWSSLSWLIFLEITQAQVLLPSLCVSWKINQQSVHYYCTYILIDTL